MRHLMFGLGVFIGNWAFAPMIRTDVSYKDSFCIGLIAGTLAIVCSYIFIRN